MVEDEESLLNFKPTTVIWEDEMPHVIISRQDVQALNKLFLKGHAAS